MYIIVLLREANSIALSDTYLKKLKSKNSNIVIETIELWDENLPDFDADKAAAKMAFLREGQMNHKKISLEIHSRNHRTIHECRSLCICRTNMEWRTSI